MIRVYADFNDRTPDDGCWILQYAGIDLDQQTTELGLSVGDHVLLYQDEGDFNVSAALDFRFIEALGRRAWIAYPDWATMVRTGADPTSGVQGSAARRVA